MPVHNNSLFIQLNLYAGSLPQDLSEKKRKYRGKKKKKKVEPSTKFYIAFLCLYIFSSLNTQQAVESAGLNIWTL